MHNIIIINNKTNNNDNNNNNNNRVIVALSNIKAYTYSQLYKCLALHLGEDYLNPNIINDLHKFNINIQCRVVLLRNDIDVECQ
jgi:hypothetical protein